MAFIGQRRELLQNYCHVMISEQSQSDQDAGSHRTGRRTIRRETPYKVRYAFNYCTLDYTFAFFDEEAFQKEYDWLALSGVNVVLDLAGQEAVWIRFLMNFGYSFDEAKDWLSGPSYYAWQFMDNPEIFGGPIPDGWITDRLNMAGKPMLETLIGHGYRIARICWHGADQFCRVSGCGYLETRRMVRP